MTLPSLMRASATPSTNELSDVFVHDAMIKPRHVAIIAVERFMTFRMILIVLSYGFGTGNPISVPSHLWA